MNQLARALYSPVLADPRRPANTTRFVYLRPGCPGVLRRLRTGSPTTPRRCSGSRPAATRTTRRSSSWSASCPPESELFRRRWASHDVQFHRSGRKRLRHPVVGQLDLDFESMELSSAPGLHLIVYTAAAGTPTADALKLSPPGPPPRTSWRPRTVPAPVGKHCGYLLDRISPVGGQGVRLRPRSATPPAASTDYPPGE